MLHEKELRKYYQLLKRRIEAYCNDLKEKLKRIPVSTLKKVQTMDISDEEIVTIRENSYPLKVKAKDCVENYKKLREKTKRSEYHKYLSLFRETARNKPEINGKTIYNTVEMEMVKEFETHKETLYEVLIVMNALIRYLKAKNKEER